MRIDKEQRATVFDVKESETRKNTITATLSTYEGKDKEEKSKYASWNTSFVGSAYEKSKSLKNKDVIVLTNAKVENTYNKEKKKTYINITVFDYEMYEKEEHKE